MLAQVLGNYPLVAALSAILLAQAVKIPLHYAFHGEWDMSRFVGTGGMPSSHSAGVTALASAVAYEHGLNSTWFALSLILGLVVMYDAMGIRRHAGEQAIAINELKREFDKHLELDDPEFSREYLRRQKKFLKELLGHQPIEVAGGAAFGVAIGVFFHYFYM